MMRTQLLGSAQKFTSKKWLVSAAFVALSLSACGSGDGTDTAGDTVAPESSTTETVEPNDESSTEPESPADEVVASDECEVDPELQAKFEEAPEPSDFEMDDLRNEVFASMDCMADEVETVKLEDLSTLMYVPDGGFTWYPETEELANHGFAVSVGGGQLVKDIRDLSPNEVEEILIEYVDTYQDSEDWITGKSAIGGWQNPDTGDVALNISIVEDDIKEARKIAEENDQLAIFDLQLFTSVWTDGVTP